MAQEQQFKRHTAYKLRIGDVLVGKPTMNGEKFGFLELGNRKISRVNLMANIVDKYEADGERKYIFLTLDDGSGQIKAKVFGDDSAKFRGFSQGQTVVCIGLLRYWNSEIYIAPEIIKETSPRYLLLRKLETEKNKIQNQTQEERSMEKEQIVAIKDSILDLVKATEEKGGIELAEITSKFGNFSSSIISQEIQKLLEEGIVFEPRPGKIRYLG